MDIPVHDQLIWAGCARATRRLERAAEDDSAPLVHFPRLVRGSWINDMNQASCFFDVTGAVEGRTQLPEVFFHELWAQDVDDLFTDLARHMGGSFADAARWCLDPLDADMYDAGRYDWRDHIDEPEGPQVASGVGGASGVEAERHGLNATVEEAVYQHAATHLYDALGAPTVKERLQMEPLTLLGRALHTVQDFYAHTNYVELLLWTMADRGHLAPPVVAAFNDPPAFLEYERALDKRLLLRDRRAGRAGDDEAPLFFAYGPSPEETPLTAGLFGTLDTVYSLLRMYENHLLAAGPDQDHQGVRSLVFALVDFPRKDLVRFALRVYDAFGDIVDAVARFAQRQVLGCLESELVSRFPDQEGQIRDATAVLEAYSSKEAGNWCRAGKLAYLRRVIERRLLSRLEGWTPGQAIILPNHSLLNKDGPPDHPLDLVRFNLACSLAADATTELVHLYFEGRDDYLPVLERYLVHPTRHADAWLERDLSRRAEAMLATYWRVDNDWHDRARPTGQPFGFRI